MKRLIRMIGYPLVLVAWAWISLLTSSHGCANDGHKTAPELATRVADRFEVFDALLHRGKPESATLGMRKLYMIYASGLWIQGQDRDEPIERQVRAAARRLPDGVLVCVDIEHWDIKGAQARESIRKLKLILRWLREEKPTIQLGYYGLMPVTDYWRAIRGPEDPRYQTWVEQNHAIAELAQHVDVIFPSLYTYYADEDGWQRFALANLQQARRYGKPVYPFLWPSFHDSNDALSNQLIPESFWRRQLAVCREHADGVVIWGKRQRCWDEQAPWWRQTRAFMERIRRTEHSSPQVENRQ